MATANAARGLKWLTSAVGALVGFISGDGSDVQLWQSGLFAGRPAATAFNVGASYFATDKDGGTLYRNYNAVSWQQVAPGLAFATGVQLYLRDTYANIIAQAGSYIGQEAIVSDYGNFGTCPGLKIVWNGLTWKWPTYFQLLARNHQSSTAPLDAVENTLLSVAVPPLGANDHLRCTAFWKMTNGANNKTLNAKIGTDVGYTQAFTASATAIHVYEMHNRNDASSQMWLTSNKTMIGDSTGANVATTTNTSTSKNFTLTGQKATGAENLEILKSDLYLCGGF